MTQAERRVKPQGSTPLRPRSPLSESASASSESFSPSSTTPERYVVYGEIASGGMASVQYGKLVGPHGFTRPVAIKRLHPHFAKEAEFMSMFIDEARLSARLVHANIIHTLDVIQAPGEIALVMEYVHGESLWTLLRLTREQGGSLPLPIATALIASTLHGLHAAHEARAEDGKALQIVHRDVSPPNILIGSDGIPRVLDFGIAKALGRLHATPSGEIKGKLGYIAPEQLHAAHVDRRTDVYGAAAVLWEALTGSRLFDGPSEPAIVHRVLYGTVDAPSAHRKDVPAALDAIVLKGLARNMDERFQSAQEMALALERTGRLASQSEIAAWLEATAGAQLAARSLRLSEMHSSRERAAPSIPQPSAAGADGTRRIPAAVNAAPSAADDAPTIVMAIADLKLRPRRVRAWTISGVVAVLAITAAAWAVSAAPQQHWWQTNAVLEHADAPAPAADANVSAALADQPSEPLPPTAAPTIAPEPQRAQRRSSSAHTPSGAAAPPLTQGSTHAATRSTQPADGTATSLSAQAAQRAVHLNLNAATFEASTANRGAATSDASAKPAQHADPCNPFYRVDERGIRHPKPECF